MSTNAKSLSKFAIMVSARTPLVALNVFAQPDILWMTPSETASVRNSFLLFYTSAEFCFFYAFTISQNFSPYNMKMTYLKSKYVAPKTVF